MFKAKFINIFCLILFFAAILTACITTGSQEIAVSPGDIFLLEGESFNLKFVLPGNTAQTTDQAAVWTSRNPDIVEVTPEGILKGIKEGVTTVTIAAGGLSGSARVTVASYTVQLVNCWIDKTIFEKEGKAVYGTPARNDPASQWIIIEDGAFKRLRNKATGHFLSSQNGKEWVECLPGEPVTSGSKWKIAEGTVSGGFTFQSATRADYYLHAEQKKGYVQCNDWVQPEWTSPQWKMVRLDVPKVVDEAKAFDSLVKNGGFANADPAAAGIQGVKGTAYWSFEGMAKASVGEGAFKADIGDSSSEPLDVRLFQGSVSLEQDKTYSVSFSAKASSERSIKVRVSGSGVNKDKDYTGGEGEGKNVKIRTELDYYSIIFTMSEGADNAAVLEFLLGGTPGSSIWIDNVMLKEFTMARDVLQNGDFTQAASNGEKIKDVPASAYWFRSEERRVGKEC
jgi:hypothetical protein